MPFREMDPFQSSTPANLGLVREANPLIRLFFSAGSTGGCIIHMALHDMPVEPAVRGHAAVPPLCRGPVARFVLSRVSAIAVTWWVPACIFTVRRTRYE